MSEVISESEMPLAEAMKAPEIKTIVKFILSHRIVPEAHYQIIEKVADAIDPPRDLKKVLFYLESNDWYAENAIVQVGLDKTNIKAYSTGKLIDRTADNPKLDRTLAKPEPDFDTSFLSLDIKIDGKVQTFTYPLSAEFDATSSTDIAGLNIWRHAKIRELVGLPSTHPSGESWHHLEEKFLLNRYAAQKIAKNGVRYDSITADLNNLFQGTVLPGRYKPCQRRTESAIVSRLTRKAVNPRAKERQWPKTMSVAEKHEAAQALIKKEREELLDRNEQDAPMDISD